MRLTGKVALATGSGTGIGAAIARRLAAEGAAVMVTGRRPEPAADVAAEIVAARGTTTALAVDVTDSAAIAAAVAATVSRFGGLDIAVANAGLAGSAAHAGSVLEVTDAAWQALIDTNLSGVFYTAREAARVMVPRGRGTIITISSVNSFVPQAQVPAYAAAKGGVLLLTRGLARDLAPLGLRVNGIAPGVTETANASADLATAGLTWADITRGVPQRRPASGAEIAAVAVFLASDDTSYINGEMIVVDGGLLCMLDPAGPPALADSAATP